MRRTGLIAATLGAGLVAAAVTTARLQTPAVRAFDEKTLREYAGVYQWEGDSFVYLQLWNELSGKPQLVAFDESGDVRTLYPTERDKFFAGPGAAVSTSVESEITFSRVSTDIAALTWRRGSGPVRLAKRVDIERAEDVRFKSGDVQLAGTLTAPARRGPHPAIILVHGSGAATREWMLPYARFLVRRGIAVLGYDKRGAGGSTGDWNTASFDDLASDVVAAFEYLKTRKDIDAAQVGLMGVSQAGWVMPLAAVRARDLAFLISISGAGVPAAETTLDHAEREMRGRGMPPPAVDQILVLMRAQNRFARDGTGWDEYLALRAKLVARMGAAPPSFPGTPDDPYWQSIKRTYFHDPAPTLRQLQTPTLALFGELDNNILADKNRAAWESALKAGGHRDHTLVVVPKGNHLLLEAQVGNNAEMVTLQRFVPAYFTTVRAWLAKRGKGFAG